MPGRIKCAPAKFMEIIKMNFSLPVSILAFVLYITGGLASFSGIWLIIASNRVHTAVWLIAGGVIACIWGVLLLRIIRNRTDRQLRCAAKS
jgi:uncharacterized membrane protein (DUF485 family)